MNENVTTLLNATTPYLTDGGLETTLIFHDGVDLPHFASFTELKSDAGRARLDKYFGAYIEAATEQKTGFVLDTVTWRANAAWAKVMGMELTEISQVNADAVAFARGLREACRTTSNPIIINGVIGPAGDGYSVDQALSPEAAHDIHRTQVDAFAGAGVDMVTAVTMTHTPEAIGVVRAAKAANVPVAISFTVETDGHLPSGQSIGEAIEEVDHATDKAPIYYMINCAHPDHFEEALQKEEAWMKRIQGIRANASRMSHEELDNAKVLDDGNPSELASDYERLQAVLPHLKVLGGCCGTDHRHVSAIGHACVHHRAT